MKNFIALLFFCLFNSVNAQITLTHNVGNVPIVNGMTSCDYEEYWARAFTLSDFGIPTDEQFIIETAQVAISNSYDGARMVFNFYSIDSNFPNSTPKRISYGNLVLAPYIGNTPQIVQLNLNTPVVVPAGVERILVEVYQDEDIYNPDYTKVRIAGTAEDNDISWFSGCREYYSYVSTEDLNTPVPNANFYINVTGTLFNNKSLGSTTSLNHNICDNPIDVNMFSCTGGGLKFGRDFVLEDFGISQNEEYIINYGEVAFAHVGVWDVKIQFNIYKIDDDFPSSFSDSDLIGSSQVVDIPYFGSGNPRIFKIDFESPVIVPSNTEKILVEVYNLPRPGYSSTAFMAGTEQSNGLSWVKSENGGCYPFGYYATAEELGRPNANFYINVTGNVNHITNNFEMNISNICSEFLKEFSVEDKANVASIVWDFGDPLSGANNVSSDLSPFHDFSSDGEYTITATVTANNGDIEILTETIQVKEPPNAYGISDLVACEDGFDTGFSSTFDTSDILQQITGGQTNNTVTFIDGSGNEYNELPNPFTNTVRDRETISVRVARNDELCCFSEITFDLIINPLPDISSVNDLKECDDDNDGFTFFNLSVIENDIVSNNPNASVEFYYEDGTLIIADLSIVENQIINEETITLRIYDNLVDCYNETAFKLIVNPLPIAYSLEEIIGCDDNADGISEYFDVTNVESTVLGDQSGMEVSYYNVYGDIIPSPLPNPYTNSIPNEEVLTVRVTNLNTLCFSETQLKLITSEKPNINAPLDKYACDEGSGFSTFDLSNLDNEIIGNQNNLNVYYFNSLGVEITNLISANYSNSQAWNDTITVRVENAFSTICFSEASFNLIVNELPEVNIQPSYFLCNLEPSLSISVDSNLNSWEWKYQDGTLVSNSFEANLIEAGNYSLKISEIKNGIQCESTYDFELIRSVLPSIEDVEFQELSDNNFIKIIAIGDGDFEYSIDGIVYQDENLFNNILGGVYTVYVRDKYGCGQDSQEITVVDYPKFFTPNNDGINDFWQIRGISKFPNAQVFIYDRYGKLLKQFNSSSRGWNGIYSGALMPSSDYWFTAHLNGKQFSGHFTLKR